MLQAMSVVVIDCSGMFVMTKWFRLWWALWGSGVEYGHTPFWAVVLQHQA